MKLRKKQKFLKIFSDGSLNFDYINFILTKDFYYFFHQKDIANFHIYKKQASKYVNLDVATKNFQYRNHFLNK